MTTQSSNGCCEKCEGNHQFSLYCDCHAPKEPPSIRQWKDEQGHYHVVSTFPGGGGGTGKKEPPAASECPSANSSHGPCKFHQENAGWEGRFSHEFIREDDGLLAIGKHDAEELKAFIRAELSHHTEELRGKVEALKSTYDEDDYTESAVVRALDEVLSLLPPKP